MVYIRIPYQKDYINKYLRRARRSEFVNRRRTDNTKRKGKMTNNDLQNTTQKTNGRATRNPLKIGGELRCSISIFRVQDVTAELLLHLTPGFQTGLCWSIFSFLCSVVHIIVCPFVLFLLDIVLSVSLPTNYGF